MLLVTVFKNPTGAEMFNYYYFKYIKKIYFLLGKICQDCESNPCDAELIFQDKFRQLSRKIYS